MLLISGYVVILGIEANMFLLMTQVLHVMLMKSNVFAYDTNFFYSEDNLSQVCETVSTELGKLHRWFKVNKLSLNIGKTNVMIFGNKQYDVNHVVSINGMNIKIVYVTKFIGYTLIPI